MSRRLMAVLLALAAPSGVAATQQADPKKPELPAQQTPAQQTPAQPTPAQQTQPPQAPDIPLPPEEDVELKPEIFSFNPLKSKRDVEVGKEYFKKGKLNAAAGRFSTATKWNDANADAWLWLGEAEEKREDPKAARAAYQKYLELAPQAKNAAEIRKRLGRLEH